ncbi:MAG: hypothetical protein LUE23_08290, partial [Lachnospiraceae bacterium]|nr:hypothetical protein [Lachnospiraceae bacterium]
ENMTFLQYFKRENMPFLQNTQENHCSCDKVLKIVKTGRPEVKRILFLEIPSEVTKIRTLR